MPVIFIGGTEVAARLLRYTEKEKAGQNEPRVLLAEGIRCRVPTAEQEFAAVRELHGTQGAMRRVRASYKLPDPDADPPEAAMYVRKTRPGGRRYWAEATGKEVATHVRHEPEGPRFERRLNAAGQEYWAQVRPGEVVTHRVVGGGLFVRQKEAVHLIVSFGLDEVNPKDPGQVRRAFEYTVAMITDLYPGVQAKLVGQADGTGMKDSDGTQLSEGGKFHVHCVLNATVVERMEVDGHVWEPGQKLSKALTDIERIRDRADDFIEREGHKYQVTQRLPPVAEQPGDKRNVMDRRMAARAAVKGTELSRHDRARNARWAATEDPGVKSLTEFKESCAARGIEVTEPGWRRGQPPKVRKLSYVVDGVTIRGETLGTDYTYEAVMEMLVDKALGRRPKPRPEPIKAGPPRPVDELVTEDEVAAARAAVAQMARDAELDEAIRGLIESDGDNLMAALGRHDWSLTSPKDREELREMLARREAAEATERAARRTPEPPRVSDAELRAAMREDDGFMAEHIASRAAIFMQDMARERKARDGEQAAPEPGERSDAEQLGVEQADVEVRATPPAEPLAEPDDHPAPAEEPPAEEVVEDATEDKPLASASGSPPAPASAGAVEAPSPVSLGVEAAAEEAPIRAPLWDRKPERERDRAVMEQMAALSDHMVRCLRDGVPVTGEHTSGVRVGTLETYEEYMDPAAVHELWRMMAKRTQARHEVTRDAAVSRAMRAEIAAGDFSWVGEPTDIDQLRVLAKRTSAAHERLVREMAEEAAAEYEADDGVELS